MWVYVVMGGDLPEAVFDRQKEADDYVRWLKDLEDKKPRDQKRIYWRWYMFPLRQAATQEDGNANL